MKTVSFAKNSERTFEQNNENHDTILEAFHVLLFKKSIGQHLIESINNLGGRNTYNPEPYLMYGPDAIIHISEDDEVFIREKIVAIFQSNHFKNKYITPYLRDENKMNNFVRDIIAMKDKTLFDFALTTFKQMKNLNEKSLNFGLLILLILFDSSLRFRCSSIIRSQYLSQYLHQQLKTHDSNNRNILLNVFLDHIYKAYNCKGNSAFIGGGKKAGTEYKTYNGKKYKVCTGIRGGKYILCGQKKVYV